MRLGLLSLIVVLLPAGSLSCSTEASTSKTDPKTVQQVADQNPQEISTCQQLYSSEKDKVPKLEANKAQRILALVNAERAKVGATALVYSAQLETASQIHAYDMALRNFFSHSSPENCDMTTRVVAYAGFKGGTYGENIAAGNDTAEKTMEQWMSSPGHRANILSKNYRELGIGYVYNSSSTYKHYWVQNFGAE